MGLKSLGSSISSAIFGNKGGGPSSSSFQMEGLDADQIALRKKLIDYYGSLLGQDDLGAGGDSLLKLMQGRQFEYDPDAVNRYYQTSVYNPALRDLQENQVPALQSGLAKSGLLRSSWGARNMQKQQSDFANKMLENRAGLQEGERQDVRKLNAQGQTSGLNTYYNQRNANNNMYLGLLNNSKQIGNQSSVDTGKTGLLEKYNLLKQSY